MPWQDLTTAERNSLWGTQVISILADRGLEHVCLSPGSRSTPLALAVAGSERVASHVHFDERGAAYFALGMAKATGRPVALICTSGTAAVNYFPAIVEASQDNVPLIVLTADRPPELRGTGANQTIDQVNLYGNYVRYHRDLPCPDDLDSPDSLIAALVEAWDASTALPAGPIHLNCQFREPFVPESNCQWDGKLDVSLSAEAPGDVELPDDVRDVLTDCRQGMVVLGAMRDKMDAEACVQIAKQLGWPVIADIQFGLGLGDALPLLVPGHDLLLRNPSLAESLYPGVLLQLGGRVTSKYLQTWLGSNESTQWIQVHANDTPINPHRRAITHIPTAPRSMVNSFNNIEPEQGFGWCEMWEQTGQAAAGLVDVFNEDQDILTEAHVAQAVSEGIPDGHALFAGNSLAIRMLDLFAGRRSTWSPIVANRGASGIDGCIATAAGYAQAAKTPITAVVGDLAALHDLNSLSLWSQCPKGSVLLIINNDGGGIFHLLPDITESAAFEDYFATPHGRSFANAAKMFGSDYGHADSSELLMASYGQALAAATPAVLEVAVDRRISTRLLQELFSEFCASE